MSYNALLLLLILLLILPWVSRWDPLQVGFCVLLTCHSSTILLPPISSPHYRVKPHFFPFLYLLTVGNLPIVILNLLTYLISLPVCGRSAVSVDPPPPHSSIWASKPHMWKPSSPHLDSYIAQHGASCIFLWAPWSGVDTHRWTTAVQGSAHPKPPFHIVPSLHHGHLPHPAWALTPPIRDAPLHF